MSRIFKEFDHLELWEIMINISENIEIYKIGVRTCKYRKIKLVMYLSVILNIMYKMKYLKTKNTIKEILYYNILN